MQDAAASPAAGTRHPQAPAWAFEVDPTPGLLEPSGVSGTEGATLVPKGDARNSEGSFSKANNHYNSFPERVTEKPTWTDKVSDFPHQKFNSCDSGLAPMYEMSPLNKGTYKSVTRPGEQDDFPTRTYADHFPTYARDRMLNTKMKAEADQMERKQRELQKTFTETVMAAIEPAVHQPLTSELSNTSCYNVEDEECALFLYESFQYLIMAERKQTNQPLYDAPRLHQVTIGQLSNPKMYGRVNEFTNLLMYHYFSKFLLKINFELQLKYFQSEEEYRVQQYQLNQTKEHFQNRLFEISRTCRQSQNLKWLQTADCETYAKALAKQTFFLESWQK